MLLTDRIEIHQSQPTSRRKEGLKVTLVAVIGGFRSDLSITRKTDGNFGNVSAVVLFSKVAYQRKRWQDPVNHKTVEITSSTHIKLQQRLVI